MYGDFVLQVDGVVGQVLDALQTADMDQETLVLFSSDNGPVWYDKDRDKFGHDAVGGLRGMKFDSWEGGHRMPFLVRWPGQGAANHVCDQTIVFSDLLATFAEMVNLKQLPPGMAEDSVSFLPYLTDPNRPAEIRPPVVHDRWTVREGDWKLILPKRGKNSAKGATAQLYNLKTDLAEQTNLVTRHPDIAQRLEARLSSFSKKK